MFLATDATQAAVSTSQYTTFDIFMILFTIIIALGFIRLLLARPKKNIFAIGFGFVSLAVFLYLDFVMISGW